ncbi:AEL166Cp [Eremothecium gossypii ATCC 10895]|uniref:GPI ethanolamine phosphate transferase 2 n=1 Tax=Eremothecium gossypii (strain ATCC 10895 / CBS 109.51 / FGSC 9923 / NRRL Y-1056) TaxID=284811 RepID=GPI7_EREGS|nr:AEL166Cp [Eremothecium gossypii ATCC 10895]Q758B8.2 RecName: Full=GPI ethanolamine phosphate transferase 2; AltName: Full=Glycosylphosphatidylinositol-anchor biosynthesis protein 7 [Eremothecium gossypii ATCC 10895]AAS52519.2 AEL166Cp [Eremothecium gossypii ATCC 10895]AEY96819.1 FAEL166Cp [Eremothecium gossypii FDAG1]
MRFKEVGLLFCQLLAVLIFAAGFFPQKKVLKGDAQFQYMAETQRALEPAFDKLVLVVIDALRADFLFQQNVSHFDFVHELLNRGEAWGFTAYSNPPTVTLPRLKGITTGSAPNFLDAILNVAEDDSSSNLKDQDSWISQFAKHGKKIHFFGDDTWLKLFPEEFFQKHDGTNSFFVSDFEEVDTNVTRHLPHELQHKDWDVLILHYLGLDHIGHKGGAASQFMPPKHREMDAVIRQIYDQVDNRTLLCVMGDHGMNDLGNHGGSSAGETSAGMVFISKMLSSYPRPAAQDGVSSPVTAAEDYQFFTRIQQVDFVPTIASLFNIPIPKNSLGVFVREFSSLLGQHATTKIIENYHQLMQLAAKKTAARGNDDIDSMLAEMKDVQATLARTATNYNYAMLFLGVGMLSIVTAATAYCYISSARLNEASVLMIAVTALLGSSVFGSSFVEEEHQIWWWIIIAVVGYSWATRPSCTPSHLVFLVCARLLRGWNNSGQKFMYDFTVAELLKSHPSIKWLLVCATLAVVALDGFTERPLLSIFNLLAGLLCFVYKTCWANVNGEVSPTYAQTLVTKACSLLFAGGTPWDDKQLLVPLARLFFKVTAAIVCMRIAYNVVFAKRKFLSELFPLFTIVLIMQTASQNIPLFLVFTIMRSSLRNILRVGYPQQRCEMFFVLSLILQNLSFFQFGGTNSIATIDLTNSYNGISENYNIYVVGLLMCIGNMAPAIYWSLAAVVDHQLYSKKSYAQQKLSSMFFYSVNSLLLLVACICMRYHLFIWSVFSPKLCYLLGWNILIHFLTETVLEPFLLMVAG